MVPFFHLHQKTDAPCSESFFPESFSSFIHQPRIISWRITQTFFFLNNVRGSLTLSEVCETIPMQQSHWCIQSFQSSLLSSLFPKLVGLHMVPNCPFLKTLLPLENSGIWVGVNWRWREAVCSKGSVGCANSSARALLFVVHRVTRPLGAAQSLG